MPVGPNAHLAGQRGANMTAVRRTPTLGLHRLAYRPVRCGKCNAPPPNLRISDGYAACLCGWDAYWGNA